LEAGNECWWGFTRGTLRITSGIGVVEMEPKEIVNIKATVKREVVSREGIDSKGSDYWFHRDVMDAENKVRKQSGNLHIDEPVIDDESPEGR
jgi:hypothetical protein